MTHLPKHGSNTARFFERAILESGLSQKEIAQRAGFEHPNVISMMKSGETKVPIDRIPALSNSCRVDAGAFLAVAMSEYQPEVWKVLVDSFVLSGPHEDTPITIAFGETRITIETEPGY